LPARSGFVLLTQRICRGDIYDARHYGFDTTQTLRVCVPDPYNCGVDLRERLRYNSLMKTSSLRQVGFDFAVKLPDIERSGLRFFPGQRLSGEVMATLEERVIVNFRGTNLLAETNLLLDVGDKIKVQVKEVSREQVILQILSRDYFEPLSSHDLDALLKSLGKTPDEENKEIAKALIKYALPLTKENIEDIRNQLTNLGGDKGLAETLAFLIFKGLPKTLQISSSLNFYLSKLPLLGEQLASLKESLKEFLLLTDERQKGLITALLNTIDKITLKGEERGSLISQLRLLFKNLGWSLENKIMEGKFSELGSDLKEQLLALRNLAGGKVREALADLIKNIEGQQILNLAGKRGEIHPFYFQLPLYLGESLSTVELKIYPDKAGVKTLDPDNLKIVFLLKTPALGYLEILISIVNKAIGGQIGVENKRVKDFVDERLKFLKDGLESLNYQVKELSCAIKASLKREAKYFREDIQLISIGRVDAKA